MTIPIEVERIAFYRELGIAIREWALVEHWMYTVTAAFFQSDSHPQLGRGFVALQGFHSKWLFANNAIDRALLNKTARDEWDIVSEKLKKKAELRNRLVHNLVNEFPTARPGNRIASCPWTHKKGIDLSRPYEKCLGIVEVAKARLEFVALACALQNFVPRVFGAATPLPRSAEQPGNPPTFRQLVNQLHEILGHPQISSRAKRAAVSEANTAASLRDHAPKRIKE